MKYNNKCRRY